MNRSQILFNLPVSSSSDFSAATVTRCALFRDADFEMLNAMTLDGGLGASDAFVRLDLYRTCY